MVDEKSVLMANPAPVCPVPLLHHPNPRLRQWQKDYSLLVCGPMETACLKAPEVLPQWEKERDCRQIHANRLKTFFAHSGVLSLVARSPE